eukprot:scaffold495_cov405-Prasinococcus_capsulatus_cf.AAC.3
MELMPYCLQQVNVPMLESESRRRGERIEGAGSSRIVHLKPVNVSFTKLATLALEHELLTVVTRQERG